MAICCETRLLNVFVLGISFMLIFTAFHTTGLVQETVLNSIENFEGDGYTSLGIVYAVLAVSLWVAPSAVTFLGPKKAMFIGSLLYLVYVASFFKPTVWSVYTVSVLIGVGASLLWTAQGNFLTINSDAKTMGRNSGLFWCLLMMSRVFGNLYSYLVLRNEETITESARIRLFLGLSSAGLLGVLSILLLRRVPDKQQPPDARESEEDSKALSPESNGETVDAVKTNVRERPESPLAASKKSFQLLRTKEWFLLGVVNSYIGMMFAYSGSVHSTCLAQNAHFGHDRKGLLGLSGLMIGIGAIIAGGIFGLLGKRTVKHGRDPIVLLGYLMHMVAFYLAFVSLPMDSPVRESHGPTYIPSNRRVALLCSFLLGFADACNNSQIISLVGVMYPKDSSSAFALMKFLQAVAAAGCFYYSTVLLLKWQLLILVVMATASMLCFSMAEWKAARMLRINNAKNSTTIKRSKSGDILMEEQYRKGDS